MSIYRSVRSGGIIGISSIFFKMKVCYVFSLESPNRGDSKEYIQYIICNIKKSSIIIPNLHLWDFLPGTRERVRNSRDNRVISVRVIEDLLYILQYIYAITFSENMTVVYIELGPIVQSIVSLTSSLSGQLV